MPTAEPYATATRRVREARDLLRANDVDGALGRIRLALDAVRDELDTLKVVQAAPKAARERTLQERIAVFVEAAYSMLSGAQHDDDLTKTFRYTRTHAAMMINTVAGLVRDASETL
jgi:hypothetical protein